MNDRTRNLQAPPSEVKDLSDLRASLPQKSSLDQVPTNTDLASASIQSIPVARLSARPERRTLSSLTPTPTFAALREHATKENTKSRGAASKPNGIFKNPYFRYKGGPLGRIVAFIANVLKAIEQALFRRLKPPPLRPSVNPVPQKVQPDQGPQGATKKETPRTRRIHPR